MFDFKYKIVLLKKMMYIWQINALISATLVVIFYEDMSQE